MVVNMNKNSGRGMKMGTGDIPFEHKIRIKGSFMMGTALAGSWLLAILYYKSGLLFFSGVFASLFFVPSIIDIIETRQRYKGERQ